jgi:hypothetical protein
MEIQIFSTDYLAVVIQKAIGSGVPAAYFSYFLLLPFLTSLIAASRHLLGLTTYGTFLPAIISIAWAQMGIQVGGAFFVFLFIWAWLGREVIKKLLVKRFKIHYLPRIAILLLFISLGVLTLGLIPNLSWVLSAVGIFPFLILIVIVHNLIEVQISLAPKKERQMLLEVFIFSLVGYFLLTWPALHQFVINNPTLTVVVVLVFNIIVGRYVGFRLLEYQRFRSLIKK